MDDIEVESNEDVVSCAIADGNSLTSQLVVISHTAERKRGHES